MDLLLITPPSFNDPSLKSGLEGAGCRLMVEHDIISASGVLEKNPNLATLDLTDQKPLLTWQNQSYTLSSPPKVQDILSRLGLVAPPAAQSAHDHKKFMQHALDLAFAHLDDNHGAPFGAVIVKNNIVIGEGYTTVFTHHDPMGRAELNAIRAACQKLKSASLAGATLYTTAEPDALVLAALYAAEINRYYYAATLDDYAALGFRGRDDMDEMRATPEKRRIQNHILMRDEALIALRAWQDLANKTVF